MIWKQFLYNFMVLLNGPVKNALFCLMDRYQNVCVWFMARNCRLPKVGTHCCQRGNRRLPLQGTAGSQALKLTVPNLGTRGYHCKELPVPTWEPQVTSAKSFQFLKIGLMVPNVGTKGYHGKELPVPRPWNLRFPTWEPEVTIARNCRFPEVRIYVFEAKRRSL